MEWNLLLLQKKLCCNFFEFYRRELSVLLAWWRVCKCLVVIIPWFSNWIVCRQPRSDCSQQSAERRSWYLHNFQHSAAQPGHRTTTQSLGVSQTWVHWVGHLRSFWVIRITFLAYCARRTGFWIIPPTFSWWNNSFWSQKKFRLTSFQFSKRQGECLKIQSTIERLNWFFEINSSTSSTIRIWSYFTITARARRFIAEDTGNGWL